VSISSAPLPNTNSSRDVVVCRPFPSDARTSEVAMRSVPSSWFASVDLPTPEEPMSATVRPRCK
jgi:hypothetical protein